MPSSFTQSVELEHGCVSPWAIDWLPFEAFRDVFSLVLCDLVNTLGFKIHAVSACDEPRAGHWRGCPIYIQPGIRGLS